VEKAIAGSQFIKPVFNPANCEFCLRCIHNCPRGAIFLKGSSQEFVQFNYNFYNGLKRELKKELLK